MSSPTVSNHDETDAAAQAKWESYKAGKDLGALKWLDDQAAADDKADAGGIR